MVFNFNTPQSSTAAGGFNFGSPATTTQTGGTFGFGQQTSNSTAVGGGFGFGQQTAATASGGFSFSQQPTTTSASSGLSFAQPASAAPTTAGTGFGQAAASSSSITTGFGFGQPSVSNAEAKPGLNFGAPAVATDKGAKTFGFGTTSTTTTLTTPATTKTNAPMFLGQPLAASTAAPASFTFSTPAATSSLGATTNTSTVSTSSVNTNVSAAPNTTSAAPTGFASLTTVTKTTDSSAVSSSSQMSFNQVEEYINKWTLELEEQEKIFLDQATQINAWDKVLNSNSKLILELNDAVQKVMAEQSALECELAYIENQHRDVDENIQVLEKEFSKLPQVDVERSQAYLLVENLDTQLKQMSEDLKEIIDSLNEASQIGDSTDPIIQVGKILNAHMNSLQWLESTSAKVFKKLDDVDKIHEKYKRDNERARNAYYR